MKRSPVKYHLIKFCLLLIITLTIFSGAYSQDAHTEKEIDVAIENAMNGNCEQAIPVLKKYVEIKGFDELRNLSLNVYLNWCYLATKNKSLEVDKINALVDAYVLKYGVSKTYQLKSLDEINILFIAGQINYNISNFYKSASYLSLLKGIYEENNAINQSYLLVLIYLTRGSYYLADYENTIEIGQKAWKVNFDLFGEKNNESLELLDLLYLSFIRINEPRKSLDLSWLHHRFPLRISMRPPR